MCSNKSNANEKIDKLHEEQQSWQQGRQTGGGVGGGVGWRGLNPP